MSSAPSAAAAAQLALTSAIKELFVTMFIGFTVATTLYGVSILQCFLYYRKYQDRLALKTMVALLWILDTLTTIFVAHSLFLFVFGLLNKKVDIDIPWSFTVCSARHLVANTTSRLIVPQSVLAVGTFALGIYTTVHLFQNRALNSISTRSFLIVSGLVQGLAALNDIVIPGSLSYFFRIKRSGLPSSGKLIDTLIIYAVSRGVLTAVAQIMFLVLNVALPHHQYWLPFHMVVGKLYVNSVLASLNVRQSLSQKEIVFSAGIAALGNNAHMSERDQTATKPITLAAVSGTSSVSDVEQR